MAAIEPILTPAPGSIPPFAERPSSSRVRPILAGLLLVALGLLAAASVFASRPYRHAPAPAPTTPLQYQDPAQNPMPGKNPDRC